MSELTDPRAGISRRKFLRVSASSVGALAVLSLEAPRRPVSAAAAAAGVAAEHGAGILIDVTRCVGCTNCQRACSAANDLNPSLGERNQLSADTYTFVDAREIGGQNHFVKRSCMHCLHPACVSACTVGAMTRNAQGAVVVDEGKCIGCRYCQYACPFNVPQYQWGQTYGVVQKCTLCAGRLAEGQIPACAASCPSGALKFGQRDELLKEAHARLTVHRERYVNYVYGENEAGGTAQLYIADATFEQLGLPALGPLPAPQYAEQVMTRTPMIALSVATICTGLYSVLGRRSKNKMLTPVAPAAEEKER